MSSQPQQLDLFGATPSLPTSPLIPLSEDLEQAIAEADECEISIRRILLDDDAEPVRLRRRKLARRLQLGKYVARLEELTARPGVGDFVARLKAANLPTSTAYRYRDLYLQSIGIPKRTSFPIGKDSGPEIPAPATLALVPQGEVKNPEALTNTTATQSTTKITTSRRKPALNLNDDEILEYEFYVENLRTQFTGEIPSGDESHIVLQALRSTANELGVTYVRKSTSPSD